ncbi:cutinase family protein [Mycolicibacterium doricum]|uniref:cutinase family protein n=1 Tax=Mycolicibacterium doricum TaxID=126673 RepID=UPI001F2FDA8B|nr:cutinase family protein [Mycolicibacterium doricum]
MVYPASLDWPRAADGVTDASNRVRDIVATCPDTKMVLGGYSQGAAVMEGATADQIPLGYIPRPASRGRWIPRSPTTSPPSSCSAPTVIGRQ